MKNKIKAMLIALTALGTIALVTGCSEDPTPYEVNDTENYNVSVKYDANGGYFTTNTSVITDSYNISEFDVNSEGNVEISLIAPDNELRGKNDAFAATNDGFFLAGWYATRTETGTDEEGKPIYSYSDKWDFENGVLSLDSKGEYSATEPVLTLYAVWVPQFKVEICEVGSEEVIEEKIIDPLLNDTLVLPAWNEETGAMDTNDFPQRVGYTFEKAYYDVNGTQPVEGLTVSHTGTVDEATGLAENTTMRLYVEWKEGDWYYISTVEQFASNANINGHYILQADLDFSNISWPNAFIYNEFGGEIYGNGHTIRNVNVAQTKNDENYAGLFGSIGANAVLDNVTFENVTFTLQSGARFPGTFYGLLAGNIDGAAQFNKVKILKSTLAIDSKCYFMTEDYAIGLVCGMGDSSVVQKADIECVATGTNPEKVKITVHKDEVQVEFITE